MNIQLLLRSGNGGIVSLSNIAILYDKTQVAVVLQGCDPAKHAQIGGLGTEAMVRRLRWSAYRMGPDSAGKGKRLLGGVVGEKEKNGRLLLQESPMYYSGS